MQRHTWTMVGVWTLASVGAVLLGGCRAVPDAQPFVSASATLNEDLREAGGAAGAAIVSHTRSWTEDRRAAADAMVERLRERWSAREALGRAIIDYARTLEGLAAAGAHGDDHARDLLDAIARLSAAFDLALPPAVVASRPVRIGAAIYGALARDAAAADFEDLLLRTRPAVSELAECLDADLDALEETIGAMRDDAAPSIDEQLIDGVAAREERFVLRRLVARQRELRAAAGLLGPTIPLDEADRQRALREMEAVERSIALSAARLAPVDARIAAAVESLDRAQAAVARARRSLRVWLEEHDALLEALAR